MVDRSHPLRYALDEDMDVMISSSMFVECLFGRPPFIFSTVDELVDEIKSHIPIEVRHELVEKFLCQIS